jgi:hypothetical protein
MLALLVPAQALPQYPGATWTTVGPKLNVGGIPRDLSFITTTDPPKTVADWVAREALVAPTQLGDCVTDCIFHSSRPYDPVLILHREPTGSMLLAAWEDGSKEPTGGAQLYLYPPVSAAEHILWSTHLKYSYCMGVTTEARLFVIEGNAAQVAQRRQRAAEDTGWVSVGDGGIAPRFGRLDETLWVSVEPLGARVALVTELPSELVKFRKNPECPAIEALARVASKWVSDGSVDFVMGENAPIECEGTEFHVRRTTAEVLPDETYVTLDLRGTIDGWRFRMALRPGPEAHGTASLPALNGLVTDGDGGVRVIPDKVKDRSPESQRPAAPRK